MGDMIDATCMADHFEKIQKLPDPIPGYPNLRRVPCCKVYCCGQPTMFMSLENLSLLGLQTRLENMLSRDIQKTNEEKFLTICEKRKSENGGKLKAVDINKKELEIEVKELKSLSQVIEGSDLESDLDIICNNLVGSSVNTPIIVNDQIGLSRAVSLFKEFQLSASYEGLVETVRGLILGLLKMDTYKMSPDKELSSEESLM